MQKLLKSLSLRELKLVLLGVGAIAVSGALVASVLPGVKAVRAADSAAQALRAVSEDSDALERTLQQRTRHNQALHFKLHGGMGNLPARQLESYIIGRLQKISWGNRIELISVEPAQGEEVQIFQETLFNVQLVGRYRDLYDWLLDARQDLGFVVIKEYELSRRDNDDEAPLLLADLSLAMYRASH